MTMSSDPWSTDHGEADEDEATTLHFYLAVREGSIVPVGTDEDGDPVYDLTEKGWCRARAIAATLGEKVELTAALAVHLVTGIAHGEHGLET